MERPGAGGRAPAMYLGGGGLHPPGARLLARSPLGAIVIQAPLALSGWGTAVCGD